MTTYHCPQCDITFLHEDAEAVFCIPGCVCSEDFEMYSPVYRIVKSVSTFLYVCLGEHSAIGHRSKVAWPQSDCKPELKKGCHNHSVVLKQLQPLGTLNARNVPSVPEDTNPELAIGKQQDIVIER